MPKKEIKPAFDLGDIVFLKTDADNYPRIVVGILVVASGMFYHLRYADEKISKHTVVEITHSPSETDKNE